MSEPTAIEAGFKVISLDLSERLARIGEAISILSGNEHVLLQDPTGSQQSPLHYKVQRISTALDTIRNNSALILQPEPDDNEVTVLTDSQEALVLESLNLIKLVCSRYFSHLPRHLDFGEINGAGEDGLIDAARRFEADRGLEFSTFAIHRIKGSIFDFIRSQDWAPRSLRAHTRRIDEAEQLLASRLHRAPTYREIAEAVEMTTDQVRELKARLSNATMDSLSVKPEGSTLDEASEDEMNVDPQELTENNEMHRLLKEALLLLPDRSRDIIHLYYFEGQTMLEIAESLGVTESRISQILDKTITKLRLKLQDR